MEYVAEITSKAKYASAAFSGSSTESRNGVLLALKALLLANKEGIIAANAKDIAKAKEVGRNAAFIDRLTLNEARIKLMCDGLDEIVALADPVGEVVESYVRPNGLKVDRVRAPLGVIGIIFEARPNVAIDAAALCIKSGNGVILRGSRESVHSVGCLVKLIKEALKETGLNEEVVGLIEGEDRALTTEMLKQGRYIDVVIPRGGETLKKVVLENATMPVIASSGGNCHMYVAKTADKKMAIELAINAKCNRPSTCNALETLLIDRSLGKEFVCEILQALSDAGVKINATEELCSVFASAAPVGDDEFCREYDDMIIKVKAVDGLQEVIDHINKYGTHHSEAIITNDLAEAKRFCSEVDSAAVYVNASTRFTDGFELGLGAEMGISTQKLHVRGPIGLRELTSVKYVVIGNGQTRK